MDDKFKFVVESSPWRANAEIGAHEISGDESDDELLTLLNETIGACEEQQSNAGHVHNKSAVLDWMRRVRDAKAKENVDE